MREFEICRDGEGKNWRIEWTDADGKRRSLATDTAVYQVAAQLAAALAAAPASHAAEDGPAVDLEACLALWLEAGALDKSPRTLSCYAQKAGHLARLLGVRLLSLLQRADVEAYLRQRLAEGAARDTCRKELVTLRQALRFAKARGWIGSRELDSFFPSFAAPYRPRDRYLTHAQAGALLAKLPPDRQLWVLLAVLAGLRLSEVENLRWEDVDFDQSLLRVRGTKTSGSFRTVGLSPDLAGLLRELRRGSGQIVPAWPNVRRDLTVASRRAGVPRVTPNDLRRSFASWLVQAGETNFVVSRLLGHSTTKMVDLVYGHLGRAQLRESVAKLPALADPAVRAVRARRPPPRKRR